MRIPQKRVERERERDRQCQIRVSEIPGCPRNGNDLVNKPANDCDKNLTWLIKLIDRKPAQLHNGCYKSNQIKSNEIQSNSS